MTSIFRSYLTGPDLRLGHVHASLCCTDAPTGSPVQQPLNFDMNSCACPGQNCSRDESYSVHSEFHSSTPLHVTAVAPNDSSRVEVHNHCINTDQPKSFGFQIATVSRRAWNDSPIHNMARHEDNSTCKGDVFRARWKNQKTELGPHLRSWMVGSCQSMIRDDVMVFTLLSPKNIRIHMCISCSFWPPNEKEAFDVATHDFRSIMHSNLCCNSLSGSFSYRNMKTILR